MLVLSRKPNQSIIISDGIEVHVLEVKGDVVKIGIDAPRSVRVYRKEVVVAVEQSNRVSALNKKSAKESLSTALKVTGMNAQEPSPVSN